MRCAATIFVQYACANEFERGARVDEFVRVSVGFCVVRAHKGFVHCACADEARVRAVLSCGTNMARGRECVRMSSCGIACASVLVCGSVRRRSRV